MLAEKDELSAALQMLAPFQDLNSTLQGLNSGRRDAAPRLTRPPSLSMCGTSPSSSSLESIGSVAGSPRSSSCGSHHSSAAAEVFTRASRPPSGFDGAAGSDAAKGQTLLQAILLAHLVDESPPPHNHAEMLQRCEHLRMEAATSLRVRKLGCPLPVHTATEPRPPTAQPTATVPTPFPPFFSLRGCRARTSPPARFDVSGRSGAACRALPSRSPKSCLRDTSEKSCGRARRPSARPTAAS